MKRTAEDREFARRFARALQPHVIDEKDRGKSLAEIARKLGVTAAGLQKQLAGGTPSIRTIALAYATYGISVPYRDIEVTKAMSGKRKRKQVQLSEQQLIFPFEIVAPPSSSGLSLKPVPKSLRRYRLQITIKTAS
jgi:transcriptional regulator with XRE-family HTH domain